MVVEKKSGKVNLVNFFVNPISSQNPLTCLVENKNPDYNNYNTNLTKYLNEKAISDMIKVNSEIENILNKFKISIKINMNILNNLVHDHLLQTKETALGIADNLPQNFQSAVNRKALIEATFLHDIAKVIIPESIINKEGALSDSEREIMKEHALLSYELLKTTDLSEETLELIKNHHEAHNNKDCFKTDINLQILSIADIYSALREKRSYKTAMEKEQALEIISEENKDGKFHECVYQALVDYVSKENPPKTKYKWPFCGFKFSDIFMCDLFTTTLQQ